MLSNGIIVKSIGNGDMEPLGKKVNSSSTICATNERLWIKNGTEKILYYNDSNNTITEVTTNINLTTAKLVCFPTAAVLEDKGTIYVLSEKGNSICG